MGEMADDYYDAEMREDDCDHADYSVDILIGRATCVVCGHRWYQTAEEIEADRRLQLEYDEMCKQWDAEDGDAP